MISTTVRPEGRLYVCDGCKKAVAAFRSYDQARAAGWAVTYDRKGCYCPSCAPFHRNVGRSGKPRKYVQVRLDISHAAAIKSDDKTVS